MNILEIYKQYQIMPQLQEHQLRVAAVAGLICQNFKEPAVLDEQNIVAACLLHDMGNIVKFSFDYARQYLSQIVNADELEYWKNIQKEFVKKYGSSSHAATAAILREIKINDRIFELADCVGFNQGPANAASEDFGKKICAYSDMRVNPFGVCTLEERFADLRHRYQNPNQGTAEQDRFENSLRQIQDQIFSRSRLKPEDITDAAIKQQKEKLKSFEI